MGHYFSYKHDYCGSITSSAYDTACVAYLKTVLTDSKMAERAYSWLLNNQHDDGSWGANDPLYFHDRYISTLAAIRTFTSSKKNYSELVRGVDFFNAHLDELHYEAVPTVGFEVLFSNLLSSPCFEDVGLDFSHPVVIDIQKKANIKKAIIPTEVVKQVPTSLLHSIECFGDELDADDIWHLKSEKGSFGLSPAASAFIFLKTREEELLAHIQRVQMVDGSFPVVEKFEIFERLWVLDNYLLASGDSPIASFSKVVEFIGNNWGPKGLPWSNEFGVTDADDTAIGFRVLYLYNHHVDISVFEHFEREDHFVAFPGEASPSITHQANILRSVLYYPDCEYKNVIINKITNYLEKSIRSGEALNDKWHLSPYYSASRVMFALIDSLDLCDDLICFVLESQNANGSWGTGGGNAEETCYGIQVLNFLANNRIGGSSIAERIVKAKRYVKNNKDNLSCFWVEKVLYRPIYIVDQLIRSVVC